MNSIKTLFNTIIFLILNFTFLSCGKEKIVSYYDNGQPEWVVKYHSLSDTNNKTITGYYDDGIKKCIRNIKNGLENGKQTVFFPNGQIETVCNKIDGIQTGICEIYFENGKLFARANYVNGNRHGISELWNENGDKFIRNYKNDLLHGHTKEIRTDGSVVFGRYEEDKEVGKWLTKSADSIVTMITSYNKGVVNGSVEEFYPTGEIHIKGWFNNGEKSGEWEIYNKSGIVDTIEVYKNDTLIKYIVK